MVGQATTGTANSGSITYQKQSNFTLLYKYIKASIAFVLMIIAATGWCV